MKNFNQKLKKEIKESYRDFLFKIFFFIGKKLFTVVSTISPNNKETFVIFSNDIKLNELVKNVAIPSPIENIPVKKKRGRPKKNAA